MVAAVGASNFSAFFINPVRMVEKQQRAYFKQTGASKPVMEILRESAASKLQASVSRHSAINVALFGKRHHGPGGAA